MRKFLQNNKPVVGVELFEQTVSLSSEEQINLLDNMSPELKAVLENETFFTVKNEKQEEVGVDTQEEIKENQ